jgi:DNA-binding beta-propeller fold protein YncE
MSYIRRYTFSLLLIVVHAYLIELRITAVSLCTGKSYTLPQSSTGPRCVAYSPQGAHCAIASEGSNSVTVLNVTTEGGLTKGVSYALPPGSTQPYAVVYSPNGTYCATANFGSNNVTVFKVVQGALREGISYALPSRSSGPPWTVFYTR